MTASESAAFTTSEPGSERRGARSAEASSTTLVTLVLGTTVLEQFFGEQHIARGQISKVGLGFCEDLVAGLDVQPLAVRDNHHRVAFGNMVSGPLLCREDNPSRGIYF